MHWTTACLLSFMLTGPSPPATSTSEASFQASRSAGESRGAGASAEATFPVAQLDAPRPSDGGGTARPTQLEVSHCELTLIREVEVPARQPGVLQELSDEPGFERVDEGYMVVKGQVLGLVDDSEAKLRREAAMREYEATAEQSKDDVEVQAARAAADVARAEVEDSQYVNRRSPGAVTPTELRRQELTADRATLQVKVAEMEFNVAGINARAAMAKVDLIDHEIEYRRIVAPFGGMIVNRYRQEGEWVQAGEPVMKLIQMDRLRVRGFLSSSDYAPFELEGRPVTITVELPGNKFHSIDARVDYVSQVVEANREYRVWVEIDNVAVEERQNRVFWLMRPGMRATMTIDLESSIPEVARRP
jgi:multidrug efflux pump subunit AcrA (membrane-fusion protein)